MRVLLVEDDSMIGQSLVQALGANGWSVDWVRDGELAQSALSDGDYACVLLDLGLPKRDGVDVLRRARAQGDRTPVLVLSDLGMFDGADSDLRREWLRLGRQLRGAGCIPFALVPASPPHIDADLASEFHIVLWSRASRTLLADSA